MPLQATSGAASYDGFGGGVAAVPNYIEDVFSTWLYTGNGSTQTITNGIDLSGKGGLVWVKSRSNVSRPELVDSARGTNSALYTNASDAASSNPSVYNLLSTGFQVGVGSGWGNESGYTYASWTFRKQPKFFDVVTYTGNGTSQTINHNLGSVPGCIIVKNLDGQNNWRVYHRSLGATKNLQLNLTDAENTNSGVWNDTAPTSTQFTVGSNGNVNRSGEQHVAYLFAHDAGGFGLTGTDNVISCGSFTTNSNGEATVSLGFEPQWMIAKRTDSTGNWFMIDTMRGWNVSGNNDVALFANTSAAEVSGSNYGNPTATGFFAEGGFANSATYIYIAIRRGPMKTPTTGTSVFSPVARSGTGSTTAITTPGFAPDALFSSRTRNSGGYYVYGTVDKLRGPFGLEMTDTGAENAFSANSDLTGWSNVGYGLGPSSGSNLNNSGLNYIDWVMQRAPGFFDVVCYTGTGSSRAQAHNLSVAPEWIIARSRNPGSNWQVFYDFGGSTFSRIILNTTAAAATGLSYGSQLSSAPTASNINLGASFPNSIEPIVMYLFASCPGVSKVGSYTGTGALQTINCGFTGGARFVLIKRTDSTGDWFTYDSARGITSGNDPYLFLNSRAAEVTGTNYVDTTSVGFQVTAAAPAGLNANGGTYIYLAIA